MEKKRKKRSKKVKNNKGFTLIEIIGVVIILGIVTGIGAIAVQGYIHETKVKTYESYKQGLKGASEDLLIDCMNNNEEGCEVPQKGRDLRLGYQELVEKGYSKRLKDPEGEGYCDKSYVIASNESENGVELKYKVCLYCSKYKSTESGCSEVDTSDKTRPTCGTTKGESTEWSKENKVISVKCSDTGGSGCRYPEFSKSIGKEGEVIKSSNITIEDNAGNKRSCPVNAYVDRKAPTCRIEVDESPNSEGWYKNGPTARITAIEDEGSGVETYGMGTSLVNREYNKKTSYKATGGIITVFGYVKDIVGNEGYCSKEIKVDNTNPTGTIQMGYEVYPKEDTESTNLNMTVSNIGRYGNIKGVAVTLNKDPKGTRIIASIGSKSQAVSATSKEVMIEFNEETTGSELKIESTSTLLSSIEKIEVIKAENETSVWTNKDVSVYVKGKDTVTGVGEYSFNNGVSYGIERVKSYGSNTSGTVKIKDKAGNESIGYLFRITKIDKVAPTFSFTRSPQSEGWTKGPITVNLTNITETGSGVEGHYWKYNDTEWTKESLPWKYTAERGEAAYFRVCDIAGNCSRTQSTMIRIDNTPPDFSFTNPKNGVWTNQDIEFTVSATDPVKNGGSSGVGGYYYSYNGSTSYSLNSTGKDYNFSAERKAVATIRVCDNVGNCANKTTNIWIDKTAPDFSFTNPKNGVWTNNNIKFTVDATDPVKNGGSSGVGKYYYKYNKGSSCVSDYCLNSSGASYNFSAERQAVTTIRVCDNVGNCTDQTTNIWIDATPPSVTIGSLTIKECEDDRCQNVLKKLEPVTGNLFCLTEEDRFMNFALSVSWNDHSGSGVDNWDWSYEIYDRNSNKLNQCKRTDGDNPCTLKAIAVVNDKAGNSTTVTKNFILDYYHKWPTSAGVNNPSCENSW